MKTDFTPNNPFARTLHEPGLELVRSTPKALQVNVGLICDLFCSHCHLMAGPNRREIMPRQTMDQVVDLVHRTRPALVDVTGGPPSARLHHPRFRIGRRR